jgi:hypothetical protein
VHECARALQPARLAARPAAFGPRRRCRQRVDRGLRVEAGEGRARGGSAAGRRRTRRRRLHVQPQESRHGDRRAVAVAVRVKVERVHRACVWRRRTELGAAALAGAP